MTGYAQKSLHSWCLAAALAVPGFVGAQTLVWSADRPLTWADFSGQVAARIAPDDVAVTAASLNWAYGYEFERRGNRCTYHVTEIRSTAIFHPDDSWVRPGHRTAAILTHEQGHFDITQIHKLMFDEGVRELAGIAGECEGRNDKKTAAFIHDRVSRRVGPLYDAISQSHVRLQELYDAQTRHGLDASAQRRWLEHIEAGLRGRGWETLDAALAAR